MLFRGLHCATRARLSRTSKFRRLSKSGEGASQQPARESVRVQGRAAAVPVSKRPKQRMPSREYPENRAVSTDIPYQVKERLALALKWRGGTHSKEDTSSIPLLAEACPLEFLVLSSPPTRQRQPSPVPVTDAGPRERERKLDMPIDM